MGEFVTPENVQLYIKEEVTAVTKGVRTMTSSSGTRGKTATRGTASSARWPSATMFDNPQSAKKVNDLQALKAMTFYYDLGDGKIEADFFVPSKNIEDDGTHNNDYGGGGRNMLFGGAGKMIARTRRRRRRHRRPPPSP